MPTTKQTTDPVSSEAGLFHGTEKEVNEYKDCRFEGCIRPERRGGYCHGHGNQLQRGMELRPLRAYTTSTPIYCKFEECYRGHHSHGYCEQHSRTHKAGRELTPIKQYKERKKKKEERG